MNFDEIFWLGCSYSGIGLKIDRTDFDSNSDHDPNLEFLFKIYPAWLISFSTEDFSRSKLELA